MFNVVKSYIVDTILKTAMGFTVVHETRGPNQAIREARVFSMPERGRIEFVFDKSERIVRIYEDLNDLDTRGQPKIKQRIKVANQSLTFIVELRHKTTPLLDQDFTDFYRNLPKFIYDGQTVASYQDNQKAGPQSDTKGNKIQAIPGAYDFNDNKVYGEHPHMVLLELEFQGAIYLVPDPVDPRSLFAGSDVKINDTSIP